MNNFKCIIIVIVAIFFMTHATAFAENPDKEQLTDITVYIMHYPPHTSITAEGEIEGRWVDKIRNFLEQADLTYQILSVPWERSYIEATTKDNVLIAHLDRTKEREENFHWLLPITSMSYSLIARNEPEFQGATLEEILAGDGIAACIKASAPCEIYKSLGFPEDRIKEFPDFVGLLVSELVLQRRAAFMLDDFDIISKRVVELNMPANSLISLIDIVTLNSYLVASKNINPDILAKLLAVPSTVAN